MRKVSFDFAEIGLLFKRRFKFNFFPEDFDTQWKLKEREVNTSSITISGTDIFIDELRLHPILTLMETYTYNPHLGMTSSSDPRNYVQKFIYDHFGRLEAIKNNDDDIVQYYQA
ncbi:hypothetical protein [Rhodonellum sp.]|uniref:hypothetical protein n=1 Tax=Rhodonellum sp. TaxID=2231180 RepID=UPI0027213CF9|nr:hypothetical protein [Rhodonellum sp.]MDO9554449.1 hypothetical protein [Rhodonellum sp.]